jgi:hypothetical protein
MYQQIFAILRFFTLIYTMWAQYLNSFFGEEEETVKPKMYFLASDEDYDETFTNVPDGEVLIEEWTNEDGRKLCYVTYEGEEIVTHENPFDIAPAKRPWTWIGDSTTELDLTKTFEKYLIPGNRIELDLVLKLIHITKDTNLQYLKPDMTFEKFPGDGILIESNEE